MATAPDSSRAPRPARPRLPRPSGGTELRSLKRYLAAPVIGLGLFVALASALFVFLRHVEAEQQQQLLVRDAERVHNAIVVRWRQHMDAATAAASAWAIDRGHDDANGTAAAFLARQPDALWITWIDAQRRLHWVLPGASIGLPAARSPGRALQDSAAFWAFNEALAGRTPVWSAPFLGPDNELVVELHVPVQRAGVLDGTIAVGYSLRRALDVTIPVELHARQRFEITDAGGTALATSGRSGWRAAGPSHELPLDPPGHGLRLRATALPASPALVERALYLAVLGLSAGIAFSLVVLWRTARERVQAEIERDRLLDQSLAEASFRQAMDDSMLTGMRAFDLEGRITYVNRAFCRMTGYDEAELLGMKAPYPYWTPDLSGHSAILDRLLAGNSPESGIEVRVRRKDGSMLDTRMYVSPLINDLGQQTGWMTSITDITEPKRIREELAAAQERFTTVLEELDVAVAVTRGPAENAQRLFTNRAFRRLFANDAGALARLRRDAARPGAAAAAEVRVDDRWFDARVREIDWVDDGPADLLVATDVTARREALDLQRQQDEKLARTSRLVTMGEMASSLAHEMNQPLTAIANYSMGLTARVKARVARGEPQDAQELVQALEKTAAQAARAGEVIRRIREFVRRSEPDRRACRVETIVADAVGLAEIDARRHRVRVVRDLPPVMPPLWADPILIEQVLLNLVKNGIEAMRELSDPARRVLRVSATTSGSHVEFTVADNGPGIAAAIRERLFEPFFTTKPEGMGMGLNICRSIVEFHQGRLWVEDNPGGGCVFRFTLPLADPAGSTLADMATAA